MPVLPQPTPMRASRRGPFQQLPDSDTREPGRGPPTTSGSQTASRLGVVTFNEQDWSLSNERRHTDRSVADICLMVGLQSVGSFTSSFARVYGLPPAAYRASVPAASVHARVPSCVLRRDTRPIPEGRANTAHGEKTGDTRRP